MYVKEKAHRIFWQKDGNYGTSFSSHNSKTCKTVLEDEHLMDIETHEGEHCFYFKC